ncbi:LOW QUALITY PROTEIN: hypothetical protein PanWU01x14_084370 [Parasponia andersonii]|uniref:Uncharacterized protein n=1 Tax=Parasponia andersonii TaxID=3476 RepID=A0A2P5D9K5_PARAD|nr:LOW QUALITY PROTEIN: hypothetical protein PanWU01x14_084370 [Parasponia andersonii]
MDDGLIQAMEVLQPFSYIHRNRKPLLPLHQLRALPVQSVLQIPITHELVNEQHPAPLPVRREPEDRNNVAGVEHGGEEELVLELPLALERAGVHELDGDLLAGLGERAVEHGAEAALAEAAGCGEGVGGAAQDGVGEAVGGLGVGLGGGPLAGDLAEADDEEEEKGESGGGRGRDGGQGRR